MKKIISIILIIIFIILRVLYFCIKKKNMSSCLDITIIKNIFNVISIIIVGIVIISNYNDILLNKRYDSIDDAIKSTGALELYNIIDTDDRKIYVESNKYSPMFFVDYIKKDEKWKINNKYMVGTGSTKYILEDDNISVSLYVDSYIYDNKLIVFMKCNSIKAYSCNSVEVIDNQGNNYSFLSNLYSFHIIDNISKDEFSYVFNNIEYSL